MPDNNHLYKELETFLDKKLSQKINAIIITIPGTGLTHLLKQYAKAHDTNYLHSLEGDIKENNILDLDLYRDQISLKDINQLFKDKRDMHPKNTFILAINMPDLLTTNEWKSSFIASHVYDFFFFRSRYKNELQDSLLDMNIEISGENFEKIYNWSGGILRIAKHLALNQYLLEQPIQLTTTDDHFLNLVKPTLDSIANTEDKTLEKLSIKTEQTYNSKILQWYADNNAIKALTKIDIKIKEDMSLLENSLETGEQLTKNEASVLRTIIDKKFITRDELADIKWGQDNESFSDAAITKTISRINSKLKYHKITSITGVGYKIDKI